MYPWIKKDTSGIEYYYHPFLDVHSFYSKDRKTFPFINHQQSTMINCANLPVDECYCDFCIGKLAKSTPEKTIAIKTLKGFKIIEYPKMQQTRESEVLFRRQGNLFEIFSYTFWKNQYNVLTKKNDINRIEEAFKDKEMKESLVFLLSLKYNKENKTQNNLSQQMIDCEPFYSGFHELLTAGRHYIKDATNTNQLFHSGSLSIEEHRLMFRMLIDIMCDMISKNNYICYIAIFHNWLSKAGASFEHWHKQILALDFWGESLKKESILYKENNSVYVDFICDIALKEDLFIAETPYALAYIESGTKMGQIIVCSKSSNVLPYLHTEDEINGMSDLLHAILSVIPTFTPYNEEWIYTPFNQDDFKTPWRISINLRTTEKAGFENITQHLITPISMKDFAELIRKELKINKNRIAKNINIHPKNITKNTWKYI